MPNELFWMLIGGMIICVLWWIEYTIRRRTGGRCANTSTNNESDTILQRYNELLFSVSRKFPNETRHQTALRYIQQAEQFDSGSVAKQAHIS